MVMLITNLQQYNYVYIIGEMIDSVISKLQADYKAARYINSADDWPPDQPNHFTAVALIHHEEKSFQEEEVVGIANLISQGIRSHVMLPSYISEAETGMATKDISEVLTPLYGNVAESILIEGTPGIGKTQGNSIPMGY